MSQLQVLVCARCSKSFEYDSWRGGHLIKYCKECRPLARKENQKKCYKKRYVPKKRVLISNEIVNRLKVGPTTIEELRKFSTEPRSLISQLKCKKGIDIRSKTVTVYYLGDGNGKV